MEFTGHGNNLPAKVVNVYRMEKFKKHLVNRLKARFYDTSGYFSSEFGLDVLCNLLV